MDPTEVFIRSLFGDRKEMQQISVSFLQRHCVIEFRFSLALFDKTESDLSFLAVYNPEQLRQFLILNMGFSKYP